MKCESIHHLGSGGLNSLFNKREDTRVFSFFYNNKEATMPNSRDYNKDGKRITPFRTIHKSIKRQYKSVKDHNGHYVLVKLTEKDKGAS